MPNVPNLPGVPALSSFSTVSTALLVADAALVVSRALQPQWGIYLDGAPIMASSLASLLGLGSITQALNSVSSLFGATVIDKNFSVVDFSYKQDWSVSDYPVQNGSFLSYDKVQLPFDVRMRIAAGGARSNRQALIETALTAANKLNLYDFVTPEKTYRNCNVTHVDYKQSSSNGVGMIVMDVWAIEVRPTATTSFSSTQQPSEAAPQGLGNVQPQTVPNSIAQNFQSRSWLVM